MVLAKYKQRSGLVPRFHEEMNELFNRFFENWEWPFAETAWAPALDVTQRDDAIVVEAELPGTKADNIDISVHGNTLTISGEKKQQHEEKDGSYYHMERRYGTFHRNIPLPNTVDASKIEAAYHDGVLTITLPKSEQAKPRKVKIATE